MKKPSKPKKPENTRARVSRDTQASTRIIAIEELKHFLEEQNLTREQCQSQLNILLQVAFRLFRFFTVKEMMFVYYSSFDKRAILKNLEYKDFFSLTHYQASAFPKILPLKPILAKELQRVIHTNRVTELEEGVFTFKVGRTHYHGFSLKWMNDSGSLVLIPGEIEQYSAQTENYEWLDYAVSLWQQTSIWFSHIENAQSLIYQDDLTGLFNYRYLELIIDNEIKRAQRFDQEFSLLFIDIDNFKLVNDTYGHIDGSRILQQLGQILKDTLREIDIIIRYGGDEFVVLLLGTAPDRGFEVAERIRKLVEKHSFILTTGELYKLTISTGIAAYPKHGHTKQLLLHLADQSMYKSKRFGRNQTTVCGHATETKQSS